MISSLFAYVYDCCCFGHPTRRRQEDLTVAEIVVGLERLPRHDFHRVLNLYIQARSKPKDNECLLDCCS